MAFHECDADIKFLKDILPTYDGNPKLLNFYIREVENILTLIDAKSRGHPALVCIIKSKLSGTAREALAYGETALTWHAIKSTLCSRLGETRTEIQIMQELTRTRRHKNEDSESFGKRIRELLDTLYSIGRHSDKTYYESMAIEHFVDQLDFQVSMGVRISKPLTLEAAIVLARQEEARPIHNNHNKSGFNPSQPNPFKQKDIPRQQTHFRNTVQPHTFFQQPLHFPQMSRPLIQPQPNFVPQENNLTPAQRQQWVQSMLPWKNRPSGSGNFRPGNPGMYRGGQSGNFRQFNVPQQVNPPTKSSDVTMRSVTKPEKPQFAVEELFYTQDYPYQQEVSQNAPIDYGEYYYYPQHNEGDLQPEEGQQTELEDLQDFPNSQESNNTR